MNAKATTTPMSPRTSMMMNGTAAAAPAAAPAARAAAPGGTGGSSGGSGCSGGSGGAVPPPKNGHRYKVLAYLRVSREEEQTGSHTFQTQQLRIGEKLDALLGGPTQYETVLLKDDGVSGGYGPQATGIEKRVRKTLRQVQDELHTGAYDLFIVYHTDRLARSPRWFFQLLEDDILPNALFVSVCEEMNLASAQGRAMVGMVAVMNAMTRDRIIERNRDAVDTRIQLGYYQGQVPYGWQWEPSAQMAERARRRIVPVPEQGRIIIQVKDWYLAGWSLQRIVRELNERGVPPPSAHLPPSARFGDKLLSGKWNYASLCRMICSPLHVGLVQSKRLGLIPGEHRQSRYFTPEEREQILEARVKRKTFSPTKTGAQNDDRLLNGLPRCARCGNRLRPTTHSGGKYRVYRCMNGQGHGKYTCPGVSVGEDELDAAVVSLVEQVARDPRMQALLQAAAHEAAGQQDDQMEQERAQLQAQLREQEEQSARLLDLLCRNVIDEDEFGAQNQRLRQKQASLRARKAQMEQTLAHRTEREQQAARVCDLTLRFPALWQHLDLMERREVLRHLVESLTVDQDAAHSGPLKSGNVTAIVRVRVALLPEQTLVLRRAKRQRQEKATTGLAGLTPRQLAYLYWVSQNKTNCEAAVLMGVSVYTIRNFTTGIRKRTGLFQMAEAARQARGYIQARLSTLPLDEQTSRSLQAKTRSQNSKDQNSKDQNSKEDSGGFHLSSKLLEVLPLLGSGANSPEVAAMLGLPRSTVSNRRQMILDITRSKTIFEAVQKARKAGLL